MAGAAILIIEIGVMTGTRGPTNANRHFDRNCSYFFQSSSLLEDKFVNRSDPWRL
jgi:hypothetical protein